MNFRFSRFAICCLIFLIPFGGIIGFGQSADCYLTNKVIHSGEKILFRVYYNAGFIWVPAGEASFTTGYEVINGRPAFHIIGAGQTFNSYDWFFKVRDKYETWIDIQTGLPLQFKRHVREGSYSFDNLVKFDYQALKAHATTQTISIPNCIQDVLSSIFYARNIDYSKLKIGEKVPFQMYLDNQVYSIYIRYLGKEVVKTKYGKFRAIKIAPLLIKGTLFKGGEEMTVWISDDENHIPLRASSPIVVGKVFADMMGFENLQYPLSSLIKKR